MNLLGAILYDPAGSVSKATSAGLAMTAFDTTNLRLAVTVPAHGMVRFRLQCMLQGSTTFPQVLLGVLDGATIVGRIAPTQTVGGTAAATTFVVCTAEFTVSGLTPGATNFDAAYGVETAVLSTNIKYGGANDTTANNAFGGFVFEAFDPSPNPANFGLLSIDSNGRIDVIKIAGTTQTARDIGSSVLLSSGTGTGQLDFSSGIVKANVTQFGGSNGTFFSGRPEVNSTHWGGTAVGSASVRSNIIELNNSSTAAGRLSNHYAQAGFGEVICNAQIDVVTNQTQFTLNYGPQNNDAINGCMVVVTDAANADQKCIGKVLDWNAGTYGLTLVSDPGIFTMATGDLVTIYAKIPETVGAINANVITAASIAADAITAAKVADGTIDAATFAAGAINADAIADGAIDAATFAAGAINAAAIASDAITDAKVASDVTIASVTGSVGSVATGGITAASFAAGAIDAAAIAANAIGASELAADAVAEIAAACSAAIPDVLVSTTIATLASQLQFTLTAGSADDKAYNACLAIITDASTAVQKAVVPILQYTGASKTVRLAYDPAVFTMAASDLITIVAAAYHPEVHCDLSVKSTEGLAAQVNVWMTVAGRIVPVASLDASASCSVVVSEHDSGATHFTAAGAAADLHSSRFEYEQTTPNFTDDRQYSAVASVTLNSQTFSTTHNNIVVG